MTTLFISDLHLDADLPRLTDAFLAFMRQRAAQAEALFILGDFFEVWIGDDDESAFNLDIADELRKFSDRGGRLFLMVGNRDFLLGEHYASRCGAELLPDPTVIDLYGTPTLLMHGDSLCTRDAEYMAFRAQSRSPQWQAQMLSQTLAARRAFARQAREKSQQHNRMQASDIMDVTPDEVVRVMQVHGVRRLIHGHTHRPARHPLLLDGEAAERIVLGDWGDYVWWLEAQADGSLELNKQATVQLLNNQASAQ